MLYFLSFKIFVQLFFKIVIKKQIKTTKKCFLKILYFFLKNKKKNLLSNTFYLFFIMEIFYIDGQINYYKIQ